MEVTSEYSEVSAVTFEWTLRGLKNLFDTTKGDKKSKVTKSIRFGNDKWQIIFYANAGQQKEGAEGGFISLFLSCEPTPEEKEAALASSGRWVREGVYKFSFEIRNLSKTILYSSKEAHNHTFTYKTANWGWPQFARRDSIYYQSMQAKTQDAFIIACTITSSPSTPRVSSDSRQSIPKTLLDTVGALLDDPRYSDVKFVIKSRRIPDGESRFIWASKRMLQRVDYFRTMFSSAFAETSNVTLDIDVDSVTPRTLASKLGSPDSTCTSIIDHLADSDDEDEEIIMPLKSSDSMLVDTGRQVPLILLESDGTTDKVEREGGDTPEYGSSSAGARGDEDDPLRFSNLPSALPTFRVEIRDVAYTTYRAMLFYVGINSMNVGSSAFTLAQIYTDNIVFAPLSSSFHSAHSDTGMTQSESLPSLEGCESPSVVSSSSQNSPCSRAEWITEWMAKNSGRPAPCSAKSMYRLADRLDLGELKERAAQHLFKSLTVDNIAYEIFSPFAATSEAIRKTEVDFFLKHWNQIRCSDVMKDVWLQIRNGKHPGFEEVWPLIAKSLEFRPTWSSGADVGNRDAT